jgi:hypothetical protein
MLQVLQTKEQVMPRQVTEKGLQDLAPATLLQLGILATRFWGIQKTPSVLETPPDMRDYTLLRPERLIHLEHFRFPDGRDFYMGYSRTHNVLLIRQEHTQ